MLRCFADPLLVGLQHNVSIRGDLIASASLSPRGECEVQYHFFGAPPAKPELEGEASSSMVKDEPDPSLLGLSRDEYRAV